jgi:hypothetical protein
MQGEGAGVKRALRGPYLLSTDRSARRGRTLNPRRGARTSRPAAVETASGRGKPGASAATAAFLAPRGRAGRFGGLRFLGVPLVADACKQQDLRGLCPLLPDRTSRLAGRRPKQQHRPHVQPYAPPSERDHAPLWFITSAEG